jgi:hypothetical protein
MTSIQRAGSPTAAAALPVRRLAAAAALLPLVLASCGGGSEPRAASVVRDVVGDTTIVRVTGDGPWGVAELTEDLRIGAIEGADEYMFGRLSSMAVDAAGTMYVLDSQALEVRVYDGAGTFLRRIGRAGEGPGELKQPAGMAFLPDGRLVVRDPGNARMNIYSTDGTALDSWPIPGGFFTSAPIFVDTAGQVYTDIIAERRDDGAWKTGLLRLDSAGAVVDTVRRPLDDYEVPQLVARRVEGSNRSMSTTGVPFWPNAVTTLNRHGEFVGGVADRYALTTWRADGTLQRIERAVPRVAVHADEAATEIERVTRNMRRTQDSWRWDGPRPPADKPFFRTVRVGEDGRIWVLTSQPAERVAPDADAQPDAEGRRPLDRWVEPAVYDVFEGDGDFLGTVRFPPRFQPVVLRGDQVWGFIQDEYDVGYVVRLRVSTQR